MTTAELPSQPTEPAPNQSIVEFNRHQQTVQQARYYATAARAVRFVVRTGGTDFAIENEVRNGQELLDIVFPGGNVFSVTEQIQRHWQDAGRA